MVQPPSKGGYIYLSLHSAENGQSLGVQKGERCWVVAFVLAPIFKDYRVYYHIEDAGLKRIFFEPHERGKQFCT